MLRAGHPTDLRLFTFDAQQLAAQPTTERLRVSVAASPDPSVTHWGPLTAPAVLEAAEGNQRYATHVHLTLLRTRPPIASID